ncbi:hypothetical protein [Polluticoccus soli]|uniref:hypothetical protein n=1 Tax=Polluticoccus soli TaxID=3034150 RepID=UPI0023E1E527|nr:hypothetical protein [Flavipsychrobacter sp. JY13-12]
MLKRVGGWNYAGIVIIAGVMGSYSWYTLLKPDELKQLHEQWGANFLMRQAAFTFYSFMALCILLLINVLYDLKRYGEVNWRKLVDIILFGMIVCFAVTLLGNLWLMTR